MVVVHGDLPYVVESVKNSPKKKIQDNNLQMIENIWPNSNISLSWIFLN